MGVTFKMIRIITLSERMSDSRTSGLLIVSEDHRPLTSVTLRDLQMRYRPLRWDCALFLSSTTSRSTRREHHDDKKAGKCACFYCASSPTRKMKNKTKQLL